MRPANEKEVGQDLICPNFMEKAIKTKPIDRLKSSNKRCINCTHWKKAITAGPGPSWSNDAQALVMREKVCQVAGGKEVNYWNCCRKFEWDPEKEYTTPLLATQTEIMCDTALLPLIGELVYIKAGRNRLTGILTGVTQFDLLLSDATIPRGCKFAKQMPNDYTAVVRAAVETIERRH